MELFCLLPRLPPTVPTGAHGDYIVKDLHRGGLSSPLPILAEGEGAAFVRGSPLAMCNTIP